MRYYRDIIISFFCMVRSKVKQIKTNMDYSFPLKDKSAIVIMPSDNKLWNYEAYDYSGVFIGYLGPTEDNPLFSATV